MRTVTSVLVALCMLPCIAMAATIDLTWTYPASPPAPAATFIMQRCAVVAPATNCTNFADLPAGGAITGLTFSDTTAVDNMLYCYVALASSGGQRSAPSNPFCVGKILLTAPGSLNAVVR